MKPDIDKEPPEKLEAVIHICRKCGQVDVTKGHVCNPNRQEDFQ